MTNPVPDAAGAQEPSFVLHQVLDHQHHGAVAWAFEVPAGWTARSDLRWVYENVSFPVTSAALATRPNGLEACEFFPAASFCWIQPDYGYCRPGQASLGQIFLPPMPAVEAMVRWLVPQHRGGRPGVTLLDARPLPGLARELGIDTKALPADGAVARIGYTEGGVPVEEEIYGATLAQQVPYCGPMGMMTQVNWGFVRAFGFRAARGELDLQRELFWRIARSARVNPAWEQLHAGICQQLQAQFDQYIAAGYAQIQAAGQLSRAISANNDALLNAFEHQRQAAAHTSRSSASSDRSPTDGFSEYLRGVETMDDPYWGESQQDYNHRYHWTDGSGNYQHSSDPFFNRNLGGTQNWTLMQPKPR